MKIYHFAFLIASHRRLDETEVRRKHHTTSFFTSKLPGERKRPTTQSITPPIDATRPWLYRKEALQTEHWQEELPLT